MFSPDKTTLGDRRRDGQDWFKLDFEGGPRQPRIAVAAPTDAERCIDVLTLAFANDAAARWLYPDSSHYLRYFPQFVRAFGGGAFESNAAHLLNDCAVALWLPPGSHADDAALIDLVEQSIPAGRRDGVLAVFEQMDQYHPREPHWHLPLIGVDPLQQRSGYGSALLKYMLPQCDEQQMPAYLEATNPENVALYERHGFVVIGVIQAHTSPPIFPMVRRPR